MIGANVSLFPLPDTDNEHVYMELMQKLYKYCPKEWKKEVSKVSVSVLEFYLWFSTVQTSSHLGHVSIGTHSTENISYGIIGGWIDPAKLTELEVIANEGYKGKEGLSDL